MKMYTFRLALSIVVQAFLILACSAQPGASLVAKPSPSPATTIVGRREYFVRQKLELRNQGPGKPEKQNVWVALIQSWPPYQVVRSMVVTPRNYLLVNDENGNRYAEFDFSGQPPGAIRTIEIQYDVVVNELAYDLSHCQGELFVDFTMSELHIESANPQIISLADRLSRGKQNTCQQVRAFYDYIGDELVYSFNGNDWGAQATLGPMGSDCTEFSSLLIALSRSQAIPARYFEGLIYPEKAMEGITGVEHAWVDVYLPGTGWVAIDPTLGKSSIYRDTYFAHHTAEHIIVTMGRNPSTLRGSSYWSHLYWPGNNTKIEVDAKWEIERSAP